jgi:hypothetical protein
MAWHHPLKKRPFLFGTPESDLLMGKELPHLYQIFNGLFLEFGLGFNHFKKFHPYGFDFHGGVGKKLAQFESSGDQLRPEELCLFEIGLLEKSKFLILFGREIKL